MKKLLSRLPFAFAIALTALAVGPKIPCILTFSPVPDSTGYWFYWRAPAGQYSDVQRRPLSTNDARGVDMSTWPFAKGDYVIMITATNATGMESSPSDDVLWHYWNPNKPTNVVISSK
jgi:hypothetical protein